jgi:hypothetical protein
MFCYVSACEGADVVFVAPPYFVEHGFLDVCGLAEEGVVCFGGLKEEEVGGCAEFVAYDAAGG